MTDASHNAAGSEELRCPVNSRAGADALAVTLMLLLAVTGLGLSLMPVVADQLKADFGYSESQIGLLTSVFMFTLGAAAIPSGMAAARWGGRLLFLGLGFLAVGSVLFALSGSYGWFIGGRLLQGVGAGVIVPAASAVIADSIALQFRGRAWGIFGTGHGVGVVVALLLMPSIAGVGGYRAVFLATAGLCAVVGAIALVQATVRVKPTHCAEVVEARALLGALRAVVANRRVLLLSLFNVAALAVGVSALVWTPTFLQAEFGASLGVSAYLTAGLGVAQLVGNPIGAVAMGRWGKLAVIFFCMSLMTVFVALIPFLPGLWLVFVFVTFTGFLTMAFFSPVFASIAEVVEKPEQVGAATGLLEIFGFSGALLAPWLFGLFLDGLGEHGGYVAGYLLLAAFGAVATVGTAFFKLPRGRRPG
ncbi:MAG: MFS transporter [Acidobacteriota bacterium]